MVPMKTQNILTMSIALVNGTANGFLWAIPTRGTIYSAIGMAIAKKRPNIEDA